MQPARLSIFSILLGLLFLSGNLFAQNYYSLANGCIINTTIAVAFTGETEIDNCSGDGVSDRIRFATSNLAMAYAYVVVDANDIIVRIGFSNFIDFEMLPAGVLRVYAFSNYGLITASVGDVFSTATLAVPCFGLTTNFVTVNNAAPGGTTISSASGETEFTLCPGDGIADIVSVVGSGGLPNIAYIITDENNVVLDITTENDIDFDGAGTGISRIYALSYGNEIGVAIGDNLGDINFEGCGGLSEDFITVIRQNVSPATVSTLDGLDSVQTCPGDGLDDIIGFASEGVNAPNFTFVLTDADNNIVAVPNGNEINFEEVGAGSFRVWGLSYYGDIIASIGDNAATTDLASGCYALSSNFVTVFSEVPQAGIITTESGAISTVTCPGDFVDDFVTFTTNGSSGGTLVYVVTDTSNIILSVSSDPTINFEDAGEGNCRVWSLVYQGELTAQLGDNAAEVVLASSCYDLSDDFVTIIRFRPAGGEVTTADGETAITICPGDGASDSVSFVNTGAEGSNLGYVVTDTNNIILAISDTSVIDFSMADLGVCRLWTLTYEGIILAQVGDDAAATRLASGCFNLSSNFVTVNRIAIEGGTIATTAGETEVTTCPGDGNPDVVNFLQEGGSPLNTTYLITDANNIILTIQTESSFDFDQAGEGSCRIWGLTYAGNLLAEVGDDAAQAMLASGCFALTSNFINVIRDAPEGGTVSLESGETSILICPGDGVPDIISMDSTGTSLLRFNYIITDANNVILSLPFGDSFNLDNAPDGECRVWGLGYEGIVVAQPGDTLGIDRLATACFVLSDNFVTVMKERPNGGTVATEDGETEIFICPGDGLADVVSFQSEGASGGSFTYVVTDENNIILSIPEGNEVDFETADFGICRIWGLSYQGSIIVQAGDNAATTALADGCFDLSDNFVTVNRDEVVGGSVSTAAGAQMITTCPADGNDDIITFQSNGATGPNFAYVITDINNFIVAFPEGNTFNFESVEEGVCRVWGLSFVGELSAAIGDNAASSILSTGCFALSDDFLTVVKATPVGGTIATTSGDTIINVCSGDRSPDVINFSVEGNSIGNFVYIVAQEGFALATIPGTGFDFNNAQPGTYEVYGLSYAGSLSFIPGDDILNSQLASSCFDLSTNSLLINIERVDACSLTTAGYEGDFAYLCPTNPDDGVLTFSTCSSLANENYQYVITTIDDVILFPMEGNTFDFGAIPIPQVRVYGISYTGILNPILVSQNITSAVLSDACYDYSRNFITVVNDQPSAGEISLASGVDNPFCLVNGNSILQATTTSSSNAGYVALVTDEENVVLLVAPLDSIDVSGLAPGEYRLHGLSYTGNLTVNVGDDADLVALADNCYELTASFVTFERGPEINGGLISLASGLDTFYVCPQDGTPDLVLLSSTITGVPYRYLVTDELGNIIIPDINSNIINFDSAPQGICRIYGYAFTGTVTASFGANIATARLGSECFALSENFIVVIKQVAQGGTVATSEGETAVSIDLGSGNTTVEVVNAGQAQFLGYAYLLTDTSNVILATSLLPSFDLANYPAGQSRIWGLSYQGELLAEPGDDAAVAMLATSCFDLSDNFIAVSSSNGFQQPQEEDEAAAAAIRLTPYPNPVGGSQLQVLIQSEEILSDGQAFIRDQNGRAYALRQVAGGTYTAVLNFDISQLPTGLFVVQYTSGNRQEVVRFIRH